MTRQTMSVLANVRWTALAQVARVGYQLLGLLILSRLLPPDAFGLVAMGAVVTNFANLVRDLGTAAAVIQRKELSHETTATAFWISVVAGCAIGVLVVASSPLLAAFFRRSELVPLLLVLAMSFPLSGLGSVHQALLERDSRFPEVARIEVLSGAVGLTLAIIAALAGAGPYSLAFQAVSVAAMSTLQLWHASRWRPRGWYWRRAEVKEIWGFSGGLIGFNVVNYFSRNADTMIIGRVLDAATLGAYSLAYRLMLFPVQNMTHVATRALYPIFSRNQHNPQEVGRMYVKTLGAISTIAAPLMAGIFSLREQLVDVFLGEQWGLVAELLFWLAPVGFIQSLVSTTGTIFMSVNRTDLLLKLGLLGAILQVTGFVLGVQWGVEGVVKSYLIANAINAVPALYFASRTVGVGCAIITRELYPQVVSAILLIVAINVFQSYHFFPSVATIVQLMIFAGFGVGVYFISMLLIGRKHLLIIKKLALDKR